MARRLALCFFILFATGRALAIDAAVSHNLFFTPAVSGDKLMPYIEIYWQINPHTIHFKTNADKKIIGDIKTDIFFTNEKGVITEDHFIVQTPPRANAEELSTLSIFEIKRYNMPLGLVKVRFMLTDVNDTLSKYSYTDSFTITQPENTAWYSGVQLLDTAITSSAKTPFLKNGREQLPLCANFLDENKSVLHYYTELYGLKLLTPANFPLIQRVTIGKKQNEQPLNIYEKIDTITSPKEMAVAGDFIINTLGSGNYYLNVTLDNAAHSVIASGSTFFQRLNRHPAVLEVKAQPKDVFADTAMEHVNVFDLDKTFVSKYNLSQITSILKMLLPLSDPMGVNTIRGFIKKPDEMYMRYYIYNYFAAINKKDPGKAWKEFSDKIVDVNKRFNFQSTPGYQTERGAIYLRYGAPTDVITVNNETGTLPYEIWQYNSLTQLNKRDIPDAFFLFYKPDQMLGDFRLLHSNVSGEAVNIQWRSYLYTNGNTGVNTSTRAEDYIRNR